MVVHLPRSSAAGEMLTFSVSTPATGAATYPVDVPTVPSKSPKDVEKAVYGYLQAIRALGRTQLNVSDVVQALGIAAPLVISAINSLRSKGVKLG